MSTRPSPRSSRAAKRPSPRRARRPASAQVVFEWLGRIEAEYRSAAITQETTLWLIQLGASPDLVRAGLRIVDDELVHAEMSRKVWEAAGATGVPKLDRESLGLGREHADLELDVATAIVKVFCLNETVAVPLFANLRKGATVPVARRALDRILKDEVRHRDFGWIALEWLLATPARDAVRDLTHAMLPAWLAELERSYGDELVGGTESVTDDERAWGLAPAREFAAILHRTIERDYTRRFAKLGIELGRGTQ
ncbi:MAG: ferritin-like domain-containing protein [Myxococcales bacterium]|nr:ferritin-like domain-containing protein [Myxococcales bacterium]